MGTARALGPDPSALTRRDCLRRMPVGKAPVTPISAPDLTGPVSIVDWPTQLAGPGRARRRRPFAHVHLDIDLQPEIVREPRWPVVRQMEALLREREIVEVGDLLRLEARLLHGLAAVGFTRVDHWEVEPGGWLPLPEPSHEQLIEPVGHLLRALRSDAWRRLAEARAFSVRLSGPPTYRLDATARRLHRERLSTVSLDLRGRAFPRDVVLLVGSLHQRLPVLRSRVTAFAYA